MSEYKEEGKKEMQLVNSTSASSFIAPVGSASITETKLHVLQNQGKEKNDYHGNSEVEMELWTVQNSTHSKSDIGVRSRCSKPFASPDFTVSTSADIVQFKQAYHFACNNSSVRLGTF